MHWRATLKDDSFLSEETCNYAKLLRGDIVKFGIYNVLGQCFAEIVVTPDKPFFCRRRVHLSFLDERVVWLFGVIDNIIAVDDDSGLVTRSSGFIEGHPVFDPVILREEEQSAPQIH